MTSFAKKELGVVFLCVSLGVLALSYPFFVSAYDWQIEEWPVSSSGVVSLPQSLCAGNPDSTNMGIVFNGDIPLEGTHIWGGQTIYCSLFLEEPYIDMDWNNTYGDGLYYMYFFNVNGDFYTQYRKFEGVWFLRSGFCELGTCSACSNFGDCINAGCEWFYEPRLYPPLNYCDEPTGEMICGSYNHCPYCLTQENCETQEECVWNDLGSGDKCHWQIYIPPVAVEYPACGMEECNPDPPLGLVEKWLCLLKNDMIGIFCPSEETTDNLKNSIDVLNEKFPFNYVEAVKQFVVDIKTSLATPKEITISMFGASGTMNFDFLDMPITIGGKEETMGNIFTDITSIFIYIAFFFWLLAFIRRFF
jgi:hypothetical protein